MFRELQKQPAAVAASAVLAVMAGAAVVKSFVTETWPWIVQSLGEWGGIILGALAVGLIVYFGLQYSRYRSVLRKVTRDYIVDVQDWQHKADPETYAIGQSDEVKRGEASADPAHGNRIIGKYDLPPEKEYR